MKLPNGYGSVYRLKGNRRKPWAARKTVGWNDSGQPKYVFVGFYETRRDALCALSEYNGYQLSASPSKTSLALVYSACEHDLTVHHTGAWKYFSEIADVPIGELSLQRLQTIFDRSGAPKATQRYMKLLLSKLFDHAVKHEMIRPEKAAIIRWIEPHGEKSRNVDRTVYTPDEVRDLWKKYETDRYASIPLIMIFTGLRVGELLALRPEDVDDDIHVRAAKTPSGIRDIPIPSKIAPLIEAWKDTGYTLIKSQSGHPLSYRNLVKSYWIGSHRPHDCRHTCASLLADRETDPRIVRSILGHKGKDITEEVYTHISRESMLEALEAICF